MSQKKEIQLRGLVGSNPIGALAAFGLLRVCGEIPELAGARLGWRMEDDWLAVLTVPEIEADQLVELLLKWQQTWPADVIQWNDDIRTVPSDYKQRLIEYARSASQGNRHAADFFSAFGSEVVADRTREHLVKPTAFHMTSGRQKFLENLQAILDSLHANPSEAFREALFGPWRYIDRHHSLGWDPAAERIHALRHLAPTSEKPRCVRAAVWLGFQALPLFQTVRRNGRLATSGFAFSGGETRLTWPVWRNLIALDGLRSLLTCSDLIAGPSGRERLHRRGVVGIYQAVRSEFGQGYAIFRPAELVFSGEYDHDSPAR